MYTSRIVGIGHYVPENVVTNKDLEAFIDTSDEWIHERTGIEERRWIDPATGDTPATMGTKAARNAIENAWLTPDAIDFIVFATLSPDYYFPGSGVQIQDLLGVKKIGALDVRNQCSGFIYGLSIADQFIKTGMYRNILVIGSENHSGGLEKSTRGRGVTVIFGTGAGAVVLSRSNDDQKGILSTHLHAEGKHAKELALIGPATSRWVDKIIEKNDPEDASYPPYMNGNFVFKHAITRFGQVITEALVSNEYEASDIDLLIPHQANLRISQFIQKQLNLRHDQVYNNIMRYSHTTAASIPIALSETHQEGKIQSGDLLCLAAFGSGFTWASALIKW